MLKMNLRRAQELITPLRNGKASNISDAWRERLIEALEYVIEHESGNTPNHDDVSRINWGGVAAVAFLVGIIIGTLIMRL